MQSLSPEARARLAAFQRAESPGEADAERCLAALEQRLAAAPRVRPGRVALHVAAGLALAAGLLVALRWTSTPARVGDAAGLQAPYQAESGPRGAGEVVRPGGAAAPRRDPPAPAVDDAPAVDTAALGDDAPAVDTATASDPDGEAPPLAADPRDAADSPVPSVRRSRVRGDDIAAEVTMLREAKLAEPERRLQLLAEHARRFPGGAFAAERALLVVETHCELGEVATARALAGQFSRRFPGSPLAARVTRICSEGDAP